MHDGCREAVTGRSSRGRARRILVPWSFAVIIRSKVYLKNRDEDKQSPLNPRVVEVETFLLPVMRALPQEQDPLEAMRAALRNEYGDKFSEPVPMEWIYHYEWDPVEQKWKRVCVWTTTFEVDFGGGDVVGTYILEGSEY